ncbi:MAG: sn-glycerol-3-phosphate ABC transporter ATP-binding protein UgpC [Ancalomicrobiaceae bacterium]|nr:sn-glycerol-3-phosphate ABC transporter ATP-binding protein UgpC [Ancalomicrobiaceae bacterium]
MSDVAIEAVTKNFGAVSIIKGIDLTISSGEFAVFVGPSGCGKSTLLRMISGLDSVTSGTIRIGDTDVTRRPPAERGTAMVFQSYALYPHMTVAENMSFGLRMNGAPKAEIDRRVGEATRILQLEKLLDRRPKQLSGGQRQRVAIGRAIVRDPKVFLFDEPLSNLDASLRVQMRVEIARLHQEIGATMIYVTHDQVEAMTLADRIVVLNAGKVEQVGTPLELYERPANLFVAGFLGQPSMNTLDAWVDAASATTVSVGVANGPLIALELAAGHGLSPGEPVKLGIRPDAIRLQSRGDGAMPADVEIVEHLGDEVIAYLRLPGAPEAIIAKLEKSSGVRVGDACGIGFAIPELHVFGTDGLARTRFAHSG